jgi:uncharacterized protein (TIGR02996 family)
MTDDAEALLRAVLSAPDDDAPRLVYADWLEEHGDPARASFIRIQVELAGLSADHPRRSQLVPSERALLRANRDAWTAWLPGWAEAREFRRGFIEVIRCEAADFIAGADEVRLRTPLSGLRLDGSAEIAVPLFRQRVLEGIRSLTLSVDVPAGAWEHLATCQYLGQLRELSLNSKGPPDELVSSLIGSTSLPALRTLRLTWCTLGDEHSARLVSHPWVARLQTLDLRNNGITHEGGRAIAESPHLEALVTLNLRGNPVADTWVAEHLRRRFGGRLRL